MTYEEYKREIATKGANEVITGRIKSKKANKTVSEAEFRAEKAEIAKKELKATNDAEIARRTSLYGEKGKYNGPTFQHNTTPIKTDPNAAFKRKKYGDRAPRTGRVVTSEDLDNLIDDCRIRVNKNNFAVPQRYMKLFRDMTNRGNSIQFTTTHIKDLMALEEAKATASEDDQKAIDPHKQTWDPTTEHWEPQHEDITITDDD